MKLSIKAGSTSQTVNVFIQDSSSTTGAGLTGLVYNSGSLTAYYSLPAAAATAITLATQTVTGAWSSGGFVEISSAHMPGWYRFDVPDAALASGRFSSIHLFGATNMAPVPIEIELTGWNNQDAVHGGMAALPNTACTTNASLLTSGTGTDQISVASGVVTANTTKISGTVQTARDLGASVLISSGTGTGQLSVASGVVKSDPWPIALPGAYSSGTAGFILGNLSAAADPWAVALPGSYTSGQAGNILGGRLFTQSNTVKNAGLANFEFALVDTTGVPRTGLSVTAQRSIDGGAFGACSNAVSEVSGGVYKITLSAGDTNGNVITLRFTATGAQDRLITIVTTP